VGQVAWASVATWPCTRTIRGSGRLLPSPCSLDKNRRRMGRGPGPHLRAAEGDGGVWRGCGGSRAFLGEPDSFFSVRDSLVHRRPLRRSPRTTVDGSFLRRSWMSRERWVSTGRTGGTFWRGRKKPRSSRASSSCLLPHGDHAGVLLLRRAAVGEEHCGALASLRGVGGSGGSERRGLWIG
jgi:hypothetical protein